MLTGKKREKHERELEYHMRRALDTVQAGMEKDNRQGSIDTFTVRFNKDGTLTRKRAGVQYTENERPCRIVEWKPCFNRVLVFKHRSSTTSTRGCTDYYPGGVVVCLVSDQPFFKEEDGDWFLAWTIADWKHVQGAYTDPGKKQPAPKEE